MNSFSEMERLYLDKTYLFKGNFKLEGEGMIEIIGWCVLFASALIVVLMILEETK